jgi:hypothetical protein
VRFDQTLGFGSLYAEAGVNFRVHTQEGKKLEIGTSDTDHIRLGVTTKFGLYGSAQIRMKFVNDAGKTPDDIVTEIDPRIGYIYGPIDGRVTFTIPTVSKGIEKTGVTIEPRVTYNNIIPGLTAFVNLAIGNIGAEDAAGESADIGFTPAIGVSYSF